MSHTNMNRTVPLMPNARTCEIQKFRKFRSPRSWRTGDSPPDASVAIIAVDQNQSNLQNAQLSARHSLEDNSNWCYSIGVPNPTGLGGFACSETVSLQKLLGLVSIQTNAEEVVERRNESTKQIRVSRTCELNASKKRSRLIVHGI